MCVRKSRNIKFEKSECVLKRYLYNVKQNLVAFVSFYYQKTLLKILPINQIAVT